MEDFSNSKPNSNKSKREHLNVQKVVTDKVKVKEKSLIKKFTDTFIAEDMNKVKNYIVQDVLIPAIKKAIDDIVANGIHMILYPGSGRQSNSNIPGARVSYTNYSNTAFSSQQRPTVVGSSFSYNEITYTNRGDAEAVLAQMDEIVSQYGMVKVSDMFDLAGVTGNYTYNNYGWKDIRSAEVLRTRDGYIIKMPRALPID